MFCARMVSEKSMRLVSPALRAVSSTRTMQARADALHQHNNRALSKGSITGRSRIEPSAEELDNNPVPRQITGNILKSVTYTAYIRKIER